MSDIETKYNVQVTSRVPEHRADALKCMELGHRIRALYAQWTQHDEYPGECVDMGSGADVVQDLTAILADFGMEVS